ncbi:hypothetical protein EVI01_02490 [Enterococcus villorum]|uniref:Uncharacterized protein n=1 Tax=Enterococcus villorum TaxID=112904 RepID=A0A511IYQ8_9ENTE|nr:hypothetical protein EVI01_02490 [Enterococcus villorum]
MYAKKFTQILLTLYEKEGNEFSIENVKSKSIPKNEFQEWVKSVGILKNIKKDFFACC